MKVRFTAHAEDKITRLLELGITKEKIRKNKTFDKSFSNVSPKMVLTQFECPDVDEDFFFSDVYNNPRPASQNGREEKRGTQL